MLSKNYPAFINKSLNMMLYTFQYGARTSSRERASSSIPIPYSNCFASFGVPSERQKGSIGGLWESRIDQENNVLTETFFGK